MLSLQSAKWFRGRAARHQSAKLCTAVRIRSKPQKAHSEKIELFYFFKILLKLIENYEN